MPRFFADDRVRVESLDAEAAGQAVAEFVDGHDAEDGILAGARSDTGKVAAASVNVQLMKPLGYLPPTKHKDAFYRRQEAQATEAAHT